jgi:hypothetical protein
MIPQRRLPMVLPCSPSHNVCMAVLPTMAATNPSAVVPDMRARAAFGDTP